MSLTLLAGCATDVARVDSATRGTPRATGASTAVEAPPTPAEEQLEQLMENGDPVFLFFYADTCVQCVTMANIIEEVYHDFSDSVALVEVDVYDARNRDLVQGANIRAVPTLIFIDGAGEAWAHVGVLRSDVLLDQLQAAAGE